jgi:hypothetical protein
MSVSKGIFYTAFLALILFNLGSWFALPETVAVHFGRGGVPDSWASRGFYVASITCMMLLVLGGFALLPAVLERTDLRWISFPHKEYWFAPERRDETVRRSADWFYRFGAATAGLMIVASVLSVRANISLPALLDERLFLIATGLYLAYTIWWLVGLFRLFRLPEHLRDRPGGGNGM